MIARRLYARNNGGSLPTSDMQDATRALVKRGRK